MIIVPAINVRFGIGKIMDSKTKSMPGKLGQSLAPPLIPATWHEFSEKRKTKEHPGTKEKREDGARCRFRTYDPYRVKVMLYH